MKKRKYTRMFVSKNGEKKVIHLIVCVDGWMGYFIFFLVQKDGV